MEKKDNRTRNWCFILYPESAPENWKQQLDDLHTKYAISPLHDKDVNQDGSPKKPHYHIMLQYAGNKSYEQIKEVTDKLHQPIPQRVQDVCGEVRYFAHLDNPDKAQYDTKDIQTFGIDISGYLKAPSENKYTVLREIIYYIRENDIDEYSDIVDIALQFHFVDWFPVLADTNCLFVSSYIKSKRNKYKCITVDDKETGVV